MSDISLSYTDTHGGLLYSYMGKTMETRSGVQKYPFVMDKYKSQKGFRVIINK